MVAYKKLCLTMLSGICLGMVAMGNSAELEYTYLDNLTDIKRWSTADCTLEMGVEQVWGQPSIKMVIPVDHTSGEKNYPVGWPRILFAIKGDDLQWKDFDRLEFQIRAEFSRDKLPARTMFLQLHDDIGGRLHTNMDMITLNEWRTVTIGLHDIGLAGRIVRFGFNINESDYQHKDHVVFQTGGYRLIRTTKANLREMVAVAGVVFSDSRVLPLELLMEGRDELLAHGVPLRLQHKEGKTWDYTAPVERGRQTIYFPLAETGVEPGSYTVTAFPESQGQSKKVDVVIAASPWK